MPFKRFVGIIVLMLCASSSGWAYDQAYQEEWIKRLDDVTQNFLLLNQVGTLNKKEKFNFPQFQNDEIDKYLKSNLEHLYAGFHPDIAHYVNVIGNRPKYQLQLWYAIVKENKKQIRFENANKGIAMLIFSRFEFPKLTAHNDWLIPNIISLYYGNATDAFFDQRLQSHTNYLYRKAHFDDLLESTNQHVLALSMSVLGSATISRIPHYSQKSFWELYPDLKHEQRDFYAMFLATTFILGELEKLDTKDKPFPAFSVEDKYNFSEIRSNFVMHLEPVSKMFNLENKVLKLVNRVFYKQIVPASTSFYFPTALQPQFIEYEENLAYASAYLIHQIKSPFCLVRYRVKSGDKLPGIAQNFSMQVSDIHKINFLSSDNVNENQLLFILSPTKDSLFYSAFDTLSAAGIQEQIKLRDLGMSNGVVEDSRPQTPVKTNKTHTVKSGETLSHIARKYGVSVKQIKEWNKLKSDIIQIGQKLIIKK